MGTEQVNVKPKILTVDVNDLFSNGVKQLQQRV